MTIKFSSSLVFEVENSRITENKPGLIKTYSSVAVRPNIFAFFRVTGTRLKRN